VQFLSQPFVVGDRVEILTSGGGHVITGTVERVDPMRTILRSDAELPITMPNKVCTSQVVESCHHGRLVMGKQQGETPGLSCCVKVLWLLVRMQFLVCVQMLADMVIINESRVGHSRVMQAFNKPRVYSLTLPMRFQVESRACLTPIVTQLLRSVHQPACGPRHQNSSTCSTTPGWSYGLTLIDALQADASIQYLHRISRRWSS
jgi:hypothetical protein